MHDCKTHDRPCRAVRPQVACRAVGPRCGVQYCKTTTWHAGFVKMGPQRGTHYSGRAATKWHALRQVHNAAILGTCQYWLLCFGADFGVYHTVPAALGSPDFPRSGTCFRNCCSMTLSMDMSLPAFISALCANDSPPKEPAMLEGVVKVLNDCEVSHFLACMWG